MTEISMRKGQNRPLVDSTGEPCSRVQVVLKWSDPSARAEVDISALVLGSDGKVRSDDDLVFYNSPVGADGAVRLGGKSALDEGSEDRVAIDVEALPSSVQQVAIAGSLDADPGAGFGVLSSLVMTVMDTSGDTILQYEIADANTETAFVFGELYFRNEQWKFRAVGQGWDTGLAGLATDYGITIADPVDDEGPASEVPEAAEPDVGAAGSDATTSEDQGVAAAEAVEDGSQDDAEASSEVTSPAGSPTGEDLAPVVSEEPAPEAAASLETTRAKRVPATGVQTRKARPKPPPLPSLAFGSPTWSAARLFSIYGVGTQDEQEKRATSALLATAMAVKEFGRALISRIGGPSGAIETYQEVSFKLGDRTVTPDGVIRVGRGGRVWTALLETKTGANALRPEQIEAYVDVAAAKQYDAVLTLSNEIALVGGDHPISVDRRRLKKVALIHISWSEVLHEARMQLTHRGVEDKFQAWVLNELIRYLEHPKSGAAGFDDMGAAWVPIREAITAGTLRPSNSKITEVVRSWDKLTRHLSMRLTSQLGVPATVVISRQLADDAHATTVVAVNRLVSDGALHAQLRIQRAVGVVEVTADLRTSRVRVAMNVDAPKEGGSSRRVNWLLRQLKSAPDDLTVEVLFSRKDVSSCEKLKDVREDNSALIPDSSSEVRMFRLEQTFPLGSKRNGLKGAFIPSVNAAIDAFYATVVELLRPWSKPAAKLPPEVAEEAAETIESLDQEVSEEQARSA